MKAFYTVATLLSTATTVFGHAYVKEYVIGGQTFASFDPFKSVTGKEIALAWDTRGKNTDWPMRLSDGNSVVCNRNPQTPATYAQVPAGSQVSFHWSRWFTNHKGPVMTYLAECGGDCAQVTPSQLSWFKISNDGIMSNGQWATDVLLQQGNSWTVELPKNIKSGQYLMRHEMIALQFGTQQNGAQIFTNCANIEVTGGTGKTNPQGVDIASAYAQDGLVFDVNSGQRYPIPGPQVPQELQMTSSEQLNNGQMQDPNGAREFTVFEPTDENNPNPNTHLDYVPS
ncbi:Endoglucanase-4 [Dactylellina cionopaga]|nr:Endoglucanase-4 [Dactylellina cionopaga]